MLEDVMLYPLSMLPAMAYKTPRATGHRCFLKLTDYKLACAVSNSYVIGFIIRQLHRPYKHPRNYSVIIPRPCPQRLNGIGSPVDIGIIGKRCICLAAYNNTSYGCHKAGQFADLSRS